MKKKLPQTTKNLVKIGEASKILGVSIDTLRRWEKAGKISAIHTPGGTRLYQANSLYSLIEKQDTIPADKPQTINNQPSHETIEDLLKLHPAPAVALKTLEVEEEAEEDWELESFEPALTQVKISVERAVFMAPLLSLFLLISATFGVFYFANSQRGELASGTQEVKEVKSIGTGVLAASTGDYLEINSSLVVNGDINGVGMESAEDGFSIAGGTTPRILTVEGGDVTLDQDLSTTSTPTFNTLSLSSTSKQLVLGSSGTLTWTPTSARTITLPDATGTALLDSATQTITNKTISGSSNTFSSIPNSALSNSKVTVSAGTNLSGGGDITLGSSVTLSLDSSIALTAITLADGTVSAPSYSFTSDTNTGLYRLGADNIGLIVGGVATKGIIISSAGNVGIGATVASEKLDIDGRIHLSQTTAPSTTTDKLYNISGDLLWNGVNLSAGGALPVGSDGKTLYHNGTAWTASSNLFHNGTNVGIGTTSPLVALHIVGDISNPGGSGSEKFGSGAIATGTLSLAVGNGATTASYSEATALGYGANVSQSFSTAVGYNATAARRGVALGNEANAAQQSAALGRGAISTDHSVALGYLANADEQHSLVIGQDGESYINNIYFGYGRISATPNTATVNATGGSGTDIAGGTLQLAGGKGTGTGAGGPILFSTAAAGTTGTTLNSLSERMRITAAGNIGIGTTSPSALFSVGSTSLFQVNSSGYALLPDGAAATPALSFTGDTNIGMYRLGDDILRLTTAGSATAGITIDSAGNIGIGTTSPLALNHIYQTGSSDAFRVDDAAADTSYFLIDQYGNVGIGSTSPTEKLHVLGGSIRIDGATANTVDKWMGVSSSNGIAFDSSYGTVSNSTAHSLINIDSNNDDADVRWFAVAKNISTINTADNTPPTSSLFVVMESGNVGIGDISPLALLTVGSGDLFRVNSSGYALLPDGAAATPALSFTGDTNTGMYRLGDDILRLTTAGSATAGITINAGGNVGIGTTSPSVALSFGTQFESMAGTSNALRLYDDGEANTSISNNSYGFGVKDGNQISYTAGTGGAHRFYTANTERLVITSAGNVGIGTTSPLALNHIYQTGSSDAFRVDDAAADTSYFVIDQYGNVGIGATTPLALLDVLGTARVTTLNATSAIQLNGTSINTGGTLANVAYLDQANAFTANQNFNLGFDVDDAFTVADGGLSLTLSDNFWMGLGSAAGRIEFDNQDTDEINFLDTRVGIGTTSPSTALHVVGSALDAHLRVEGTNNGGWAAKFYNDSTAVNDAYGVYIQASNGTANALQVASQAGANLFTIKGNGNVGIGTTAPLSLLQLRTAASSDPSFSLADADVAHGVTTVAPTDDFLRIVPISSTVGGAYINGLADATGVALQLRGIQSSDPTDSTPAIFLVGAKANGTGVQDLGAAETILQIANNDDAAALTILGNGNVGIGTTSPLALTHIYQTGAADAFRVDDAAADTSYFVIDQYGNVGIGTTNPTTSLLAVGAGNLFQVNSSGYALLPDGAASTPSLSFTGDTNTGMYRLGDDILRLTTAGSATAGITIAADGNIGIGTTAPGSKLAVAGSGVIGSNFVASTSAPTNGLWVEGPGRFGEAYVYDSFDRANSTSSVGTAETGQAWTALEGTWGISSNQLYLASSVDNNAVVIDTGMSDGVIQGTVATFSAGSTQTGLVLRATDSDNAIYLNMYTNYSLIKSENDVASGLGEYNVVPSSGDVVRVVFSGSSITVYINGVSRISATSTFNQTATKHGVSSYNANWNLNTSKWDDFSFQGTTSTLASAAQADQNFFSVRPGMLDLTGTTQINTLMETAVITGAMLQDSSALTVDKATALSLSAPIEGYNVTLSNTSALRILNTSGTPTTNSGIWIESQTAGATNDYGLYIEDADTYSIFADAGPARFDEDVYLAFSSGNVGIGTTSPLSLLQLRTAASSDPSFSLADGDVAHGVTTVAPTDDFLRIVPISSTVGGAYINGLADATGVALQLRGIQSSDPTDSTPAIFLVGAKANGTGVQDLGAAETILQIANNDDAAALTILGNGNVGIGTTSPLSVLNIQGTSSFEIALSSTASSGSAAEVLTLGGYFHNTSDALTKYASINFAKEGNWSSNPNRKVGLAFNVGSLSSPNIEKVRITAEGNIGIGTTSPPHKLFADGNIAVSAGNNFIARYDTTDNYHGSLTWNSLQLGNNGANSIVAGRTASGGYLDFIVNGGVGADVTALTIKNTGNVGIGDATPLALFTVGSGDLFRVNSSGYALLPDGAASTPSLSFTGDTNTGMYRLTDDVLRLTTAGSATAGITIDSNGNVGIGVTNPSSNLHVTNPYNSGDNTVRDVLWLTGGGPSFGSGAKIVFNPFWNASYPTWRLSEIGSLASPINSNWGGDIVFNTNSGDSATNITEKMRITFNGNVGIGTTNPVSKLQLRTAASSDPSFSLADGDVAHGVTTIAPTDDFLRVVPISSTVGGAYINGLADATGVALQLRGIQSSDPTDSTPAIFLVGAKASGTGVQDLGAAETILQIANNDDAPALSILGNGNVGIGTTGPISPLHVAGVNQTLASDLYIANVLSTSAQGADIGGSLGLGGKYNTGGSLTGFGSISGRKNNGDSGDYGGYLTLATRANGSGAPSERIRITSGGNVGIGTTSPSSLFSVGSSSQFQVNSSGYALLPDGAAATPSLSFTGDTNTGMYRLGDDILRLTTAGSATNGITIDSAGNVGIGITSPTTSLHVSQATGSLKIASTTGTNVAYTIFNNTGGDMQIGRENSAGGGLITGTTAYAGVIGVGSAHPLQLGTNSTIRMTIGSDGNVGIGTTTPLTLLDVNQKLNVTSAGNVGIGITAPSNSLSILQTTGSLYVKSSTGTNMAYATFNNTGGDLQIGRENSTGGGLITGSNAYAGVMGVSSAHSLQFGTNNAIRTTIDSDGNVGIGTTSPTGKLAVTDTSNTAAAFTLSNNTATTIGNGANTLGVLDLGSTSLTTGNFMNIELNALTSGKGINLTSTSTALTSGSLVALDWSPGSSTTGTGDLFSINMGANALGSNFLNLKDNGSSVFSVSQTAVTTSLPTSFTSAGDVSMAYDLNMTNPTASYIKSAAPLTLQAGEVFNSSDLTLKTYNRGSIILSQENTVAADATSYGVILDSQLIDNAVNPDNHYSLYNVPTVNISGDTLDNLYTNYIGLTNTAGTVTNWYGTYIAAPTGSGTTTNKYALVTEASAGNVGIGTTSSTLARMTVAGGSATTGLAFLVQDSAYANRFAIQGNGNVGIGTTSPLSLLQLRTAASSDPSFSLADGDVAHGVTTVAPTDDFLRIVPISSTVGGAYINGLADATGVALQLRGIQSSDPTDSTPAIFLVGAKASGTGVVDLGATETVFQVANNDDAAAFSVMGSGNVGIGTTVPYRSLDIALSSSGATVQPIVIRNSAASAANNAAALDFALNGSSGQRNAAITAINTSGAGDATALAFSIWDGGSVFAERMRITAAGNVGIGTTSPLSLLQLRTAASSDPSFSLADGDVAHGVTTVAPTDDFLRIVPISSTVGGAYINGLADATGVALQLRGIQSSDPTDSTPAIFLVGAKASGTGVVDLGTTETVFQVANNDDAAAFSVMGSGNVGIGTTAPKALLDIAQASSGTTVLPLIIRNNAAAAVNNGAQIYFALDNGAGTRNADMSSIITNGANSASAITFSTWNGSAYGERVRFAHDGNVGIGTTAPTAQLELSTGVAIKSSGTAWDNPSDIRLKNIQRDYGYGLDEIMQINPIVFTFKEDNALGINDPGEHIGIVAQEVQGVIPEAVTVGAQGYLKFNIDPILWASVNAIKDLNNQIAAMRDSFQVDSEGYLVTSGIKAEKIILGPELGNVGIALDEDGSIDLASTLENQELRIKNQESSVLGLEEKVATQEATLAEITGTQASQSATIADLQAKIAKLENDVGVVRAQPSATDSGIARNAPTPDATDSATESGQTPWSAPTNELDLTDPSVLIATQSGELQFAPTVTFSEATISGKLTAYEATIQETFKSLGETFLGNTTVAGNLTVDGTLSISENSINAIGIQGHPLPEQGVPLSSTTGILYIQNSPLAQGVDIFNGLVTIDKTGNLTAQTITAKTVVTEKLVISQGLSSSIGEGIIPVGEVEIPIFTSAVTDNSKIFLTLRSSSSGQAPYVSDIVPGSGFVVTLETPLNTDTKFNWIILESK